MMIPDDMFARLYGMGFRLRKEFASGEGLAGEDDARALLGVLAAPASLRIKPE
jgi:hypothetical protein